MLPVEGEKVPEVVLIEEFGGLGCSSRVGQALLEDVVDGLEDLVQSLNRVEGDWVLCTAHSRVKTIFLQNTQDMDHVHYKREEGA